MTIIQSERIIGRINGSKPVKLFLDTDTANEIDDQFAITYAMLADDVDLVGIGAAPFEREGLSLSESMKLSYDEIMRVRNLTKKDSMIPIYRGAENYLPDVCTPVESEAARAVIEECIKTEDMVFVSCIRPMK
jgi:hypothetical protein